MKFLRKVNRRYYKIIEYSYIDDSTLQYFEVPASVTSIKIDCIAPSGNNAAGAAATYRGYGGRVKTTLSTTPGQILYFFVGRMNPSSGTAAYNASDVRTDNTGVLDDTSLHSRLIVAGGGGSGSAAYNRDTLGPGGHGGGLVGGSGRGRACNGTGGTQSSGGTGGSGQSGRAPGGTFGLGGNGWHSNAGGAGWYGGGGGHHNYSGKDGWFGGGGGGSSYTHPELCTDVLHTQGYNSTDKGSITIEYESNSSDYTYYKDTYEDSIVVEVDDNNNSIYKSFKEY